MTTVLQITEEDFDALVLKCASHLISQSQQMTPPPEDRVFIEDAINITGLEKKTIYKMSCLGQIPCKKYGRKLVFSRKELSAWIDARTIKKLPASEIMAKRLAVEAMGK
jgi:hypothetical protein